MTKAPTDEALLDRLAVAAATPDPANDIERFADLTREDAYRLQIAWKRRQARRGDPQVGYRISMTSRNGMTEAAALGLIPNEAASTISPVFSSLSRSNIGAEDQTIEVEPDRYGYVEAEVGVLIGDRLQGPSVTPSDALAAIAGFMPAIDLAQIPMNRPYGLVHTLATMAGRLDTTCVFGATLTPPAGNLQLEGILVSVNGQPRASATAWESLGGPAPAIAWLANELAKVGAALEPGQRVVTGVCPYPQRLHPGDGAARADFATLGSVSVLLTVSESV